MSVTIGVDIGQRRDPTAVCVAEVDRRAGAGRQESDFLVRHLDTCSRSGLPSRRWPDTWGRSPRGWREGAASVPSPSSTPRGVGLPVVELLRERALDTRVVPVYFTHGDRRKADGGV